MNELAYNMCENCGLEQLVSMREIKLVIPIKVWGKNLSISH